MSGFLVPRNVDLQYHVFVLEILYVVHVGFRVVELRDDDVFGVVELRVDVVLVVVRGVLGLGIKDRGDVWFVDPSKNISLKNVINSLILI